MKYISNYSLIEPEGTIPEIDEQSPEEVITVPGKKVILEVKASGYPEPKATWLKNETELKADGKDIEITSKDGVHQLILNSITFDDDADYYCQVSNKHGGNEAIFSIIVEEAKVEPKFVEALVNQEVVEGDEVEFAVLVESNPEAEVEWYLDHNLIKDEDRFQILVEGKESHVLVIADCGVEDTGVVKCIAKNEIGETSCQCHLDVKKQGMKIFLNPHPFYLSFSYKGIYYII